MKEIYDLINDSKKIAIDSFKYYIDKLGLNPDAYEHLYNIKIEIDDNDSYLPDNFEITLSFSNILDYIDLIEEAKRDNNTRCINNIKANLAVSILHEMLHANRTIFIEGGISISILNKQKENEIKQNHIITTADYYHSKTEELFTKNEKEKNKKIEEINTIIKNQDGLEETIVEVLANIMIISYFNKDFDINTAIKKYRDSMITDDLDLATTIIERIGPRFIKWYLTSAYEDIYHDLIEEEFKEKTPELLKNINTIYQAISNNKKYDSKLVSSTKKLIDEKLKNKHSR